ncbi:SDR family oxidoreductase [Leucobacter sp. CSA1]|uniref:SDR family oxidoreductase n=1 Tax=Leucobacter chromiisoli TaxID=2796471 RepID=A0A934UT81_9MICO|nr:SDR family oxidoreductase [Leucobacter chromiisoli]MBK0418099.1 SDR family oxidoreductase [Leucobacter chromiisoli]
MQLRDRVALVSGGSRGIGRGIVDRFLAEGARVAIVQRRAADPELERDPRVACIRADLADPDAPAVAVEETVQRFGGLDVLVNNAGAMFERDLSELTVAEWDLMAALNLRAPLFLAQAALPHLRDRSGSVINIGSVEGEATNPGHTAYAATKAGVHGMTRAMAIDLGRHGIRCNAIAPGWIVSDLSEEYLASRSDPLVARAELIRLHPAGRLGTPEDVGDLAVYLAAATSRFLTGEVITLDGGRTVRLPTPE